MADYSSPRRSAYSTPSRSVINPPPPDSALRDTTVNVASAFANAEQQQQQQQQDAYNYMTRSPYRSHSNQLGNTYLISPSKRFSKKDTDNYSSLIDSDNEFFGHTKMTDFYGQQISSLSQSQLSSSDDDDDPFEEEELLACNPSEEELRRDRTSGRYYNTGATSMTASSFHSLYDQTTDKLDDTIKTDKDESTQPPAITLALEKVFKGAMFCIYMVFWLIKKTTVALITFVYVILSTVLIHPVVYFLQLIGFKSLTLPTPLTLSAGDPPSSTWHMMWFVALLTMASLWCLQRYDTSLITTSFSHWIDTIPSITHELDDSTLMHRFATLEKTVHGLVKHMQKQDKNSQQQISSINWHLDQLQNQLTLWTTSQSKQMEVSLEEQMTRVEKVLETTTADWNDRLHQWESRLEEQQQPGLEQGTISPVLVDALRQVFVSKSDHDDTIQWDDFLKHHQGTLKQQIHDMMDQWIQEQRHKGNWVDRDTLNEALMTQLVQPNKESSSTTTAETNDMIRGWIDTAIQHYHQGLLGPPDYALSTRGAMIIHSLTSPTFSEQGQEPRWTRWYTQLTRPTISPMVALAPGTGQCWPMKGNHGSLGIRLSEPIAIQSITLEFPNRSMPSAPKQLEIWGIKDLVKDYSHWMEDDTNSIFLGSFIYNIHSSSRQTFTLDTNRYILFQGVVVRVLSNWGNEHYTCLYRVRVHGITAM